MCPYCLGFQLPESRPQKQTWIVENWPSFWYTYDTTRFVIPQVPDVHAQGEVARAHVQDRVDGLLLSGCMYV